MTESKARSNVLAVIARRVPVDAAALVVIAIAMCVTHLPYIRYGMCWNDPSWYFHFGHRTLAGDVPYRDYVFQVGPLPIYVDAGFQELFGAKYVASLYAGLFIKTLRVWVIWLISRRLVDVRTAMLLAVWCAVDPLFAFIHHWSTGYSQLFITTSGLFCWLASRSEGRSQLVHLVLAGFFAALVVSARQSSAVMIAVVLVGATGVMYLRKETFTWRKLVAFWCGFAGAFVVVFGALAAVGALGPAVQQMFLDAPQKKAIHGVDAVLDAISGGALVDWDWKWWTGFLYFIGLPCLLIAGLWWLVRRERNVSTGTLALLVIPLFMVLGFLERDASFNVFSDLPRTFLTTTTAVAVLSPGTLRRWLGVEPLVAIGLGALPLASDWALEMSYPGRGWGDAPSLVVGVLLLTFASNRLVPKAKTIMCASLAVLGVIYVLLCLDVDRNPFAKDEAVDGFRYEQPYGFRNPVMRGLRINASRRIVLQWLTKEVTSGSSCFIYANLPSLYDILACKNPTRIDTTAADFITSGDADAAIAILRANPPDFILAQDKQWMSPPLSQDLGSKLENYGGLNPRASMAVHVGLRSLMDDYESIGYAADILGAELAQQAATHWDTIDGLHLYRRKR